MPGTVVLIDRGLEPFLDTVKACQARGAVAVIVRNVASSPGTDSDLVVMGAASQHEASGVTVPSVFVSRKTGDELDAMLALNANVFVELFAADDVNSLMAYLAYMVMSAETLFFAMLFMLVLIVLGTRRRRSSARRCCNRNNEESSYSRHALLVNDRALMEPLAANSSQQQQQQALLDPEAKINTVTTSFPVVFHAQHQHSIPNSTMSSNSHNNAQRLVSVPVNAINDEPVFEQQDQ